MKFAQQQGKPWVHIHPGLSDPALVLREFVNLHQVKTLNVAESRESTEPGLYEWVMAILAAALA